MNRRTAQISAFWYIFISLGIAGGFYTAAHGYPPVARFGGAAWVFLLSMITTMPIVIPYIKKKYGE